MAVQVGDPKAGYFSIVRSSSFYTAPVITYYLFVYDVEKNRLVQFHTNADLKGKDYKTKESTIAFLSRTYSELKEFGELIYRHQGGNSYEYVLLEEDMCEELRNALTVELLGKSL